MTPKNSQQVTRGHNVVADMWVGCPCPPVRKNILTLSHLFLRTRNLIRGFVHQLVRRYVHDHWVKKWKTSVLDMLCVCMSVGWVLECREGLDAPTHMSATTLWPRVTCWESFGLIKDCLEKLNFELFKSSEMSFSSWLPSQSRAFCSKSLVLSFTLYIFFSAYFLQTCKGFDNLNEFLVPKSIHVWKIKKIEGCHVRNFNPSIFLQLKKMIKIHTYTPIFLHHIAVAQTFSQKKTN